MLASAHLLRPEYFHEVARLRVVKIVEVLAQPQFVKKPGCPWAIRVPATPDSFAIVLIANDELVERGEIEVQLSARAKCLDGSDEHEIGRTRAETGEWRRREDKKFAGLKMGRGFQANFREP